MVNCSEGWGSMGRCGGNNNGRFTDGDGAYAVDAVNPFNIGKLLANFFDDLVPDFGNHCGIRFVIEFFDLLAIGSVPNGPQKQRDSATRWRRYPFNADGRIQGFFDQLHVILPTLAV